MPAAKACATGWIDTDRFVAFNVTTFGAQGDGANDDTSAIQAALTSAGVSVAGNQGGVVFLPAGTFLISSQLVVPGYVRVVGANKRSTIIKAASNFPTSTPLIRLGPGGTGRLFDMRLEHLRINCNDISGSTGVYSTQVNEGSALIGVAIDKYRSVGVDILASGGDLPGTFLMQDYEIYGSSSGSTSAVRLNTLDVGFSAINGTINPNGAGATGTDGFDLTSCRVFISDCHIEKHTNGINFKSGSSGVVCNIGGISTVTKLIYISAGSGVECLGILPNGATNAIVDDVTSRTLTTSSSIGYYLQGADGAGATKAVLTSSTLAAGYNQLSSANVFRGFQTLTDGSTTPSVAGGNWFKCSNTNPTSITNLVSGFNGQQVIIEFTNGNTTLVDGTLILAGSTNYAVSATGVWQGIFDGGSWFEISRSNN